MDDDIDELLKKEVVVFGGGCFWCTEAVFKMLKGVVSVEPGYAGGNKENPIYQEVVSGKTGHAEVVRIEYRTAEISFNDLLKVFFATHNPTTPNRQGNDVGDQYRSIILYTTDQQRKKAKEFIKTLNSSSKLGRPVVTQVGRLETFFPAEKEHKNYCRNHSGAAYCEVVINPKLKKVKEKFAKLLNKI